jgi:IclR family acetate operon transcriptional repressor
MVVVKSVRTALRVFEAVAARQPVGLSELSRALDVPKASVQRALSTLADAGWLRHDVSAPGQWVVTARFSVLADASPAVIAAREAARPQLERLREELGEAVGLFVLDGDRMVVVAGLEEPQTVRAVETTLGPLPVHLSAAGRAILALLPEPTRLEILDRVLPADADPTMAARLHAEIARAQRDGYAIAAGEYQDDLAAVGAAIVDATGEPVAALAVLATPERLTGEGTSVLGRAVVEAAATVSRGMAPSSLVG